MKPLTLVTSAILLVLFSATHLFAQDYMITKNGDTIKCSITGPSTWGFYKYKTAENAEAAKIRTSEVKEFYMAEKKTLTHVVFIKKKKYVMSLFMPVVEKGKINLYEVTTGAYMYYGATGTSSYNTTKVCYISKGTDTVSELKTNVIFNSEFRQSSEDKFAEMIKDNAAVYNTYITNNEFSFKELRNLIHMYNTGLPYEDPNEMPKEAKKGSNSNKAPVNN